MQSTPGYRNASTCGFSARKGSVLRNSDIYRILLELLTQIESPRSNEGIRDNIQLSRKRQRAVAGNRTTTLLCLRLT